MDKDQSNLTPSAPKVCLIQLRQLGDILLTTPAIRWIKKSLPNTQIDILTHPMGRLVLGNNSFISEHLEYCTKGMLPMVSNLIDLRRRAPYRVLIDLMCNPRSGFLSHVLRSEQRVGFKTNRALLYSRVLPRRSGHDYIGFEKIELVCDALGLAYPNDRDESWRLDFVWTDADLGPLKDLNKSVSEPAALSSSAFNSRRVILSPTHRREERKWSADSWQSYARWLCGLGIDVVWIWGPGEEKEVIDLWGQSGKSGRLAPKTNLRELAAIIANSELFVSGSNGPSHIAVAVNTPTIQLHGPTQGLSWSPNTARHRFIQETITQNIKLQTVQRETEDLLKLIDQKSKSFISNHREVWTQRPSLATI
jgi:heptosyltransferase-3